MSAPDTPAGFTDYEPYSLPDPFWVPILVLLAVFGAVFLQLADFAIYSSDLVVFLSALSIGMSAQLFAHESLHYLVSVAWGYDPEYVWPNKVYVPNECLTKLESVSALLAPQVLTALLLIPLLYGVGGGLEIALAWAFILNWVGGSRDIAWVFRRLTWPNETRVVVDDTLRTYVAFPEMDGE